jgi:hypothetical protein
MKTPKEVIEFCKKHGLTEDQFYGREKYEGSLYLHSVTSVPEGFNPTVGGWLDLERVTSIPAGFNPTVGGWLDLRSVTSVPAGFNPTVGGWLDLRSVTSIPDRLKDANRKRTGNAIVWPDGKYIKADGIFTEILSKKGNVYKVREIGNKKEFFLVTDGNDNWSHGDTLQKAKDDLIFKLKSNPSNFKHLKMDSVLSFEDAIAAYRGITGACSTGVRMFIEKIERKSEYTIEEICTVTKGQFGNEQLKSFFAK